MDLHTQQPLQDPSDFDLNLRLLSVAQPSPGVFRIRFSDGHEATFRAEDLLTEAALAPNSHDCPAVRLWDGTLADLPRMRWRAEPAGMAPVCLLAAFLRPGYLIF